MKTIATPSGKPRLSIWQQIRKWSELVLLFLWTFIVDLPATVIQVIDIALDLFFLRDYEKWANRYCKNLAQRWRQKWGYSSDFDTKPDKVSSCESNEASR